MVNKSLYVVLSTALIFGVFAALLAGLDGLAGVLGLGAVCSVCEVFDDGVEDDSGWRPL